MAKDRKENKMKILVGRPYMAPDFANMKTEWFGRFAYIDDFGDVKIDSVIGESQRDVLNKIKEVKKLLEANDG